MPTPTAGAPLSDSPSDPSSTTRRRFRPPAAAGWRLAAVVVFVVAGGLFVTSAIDAGGLDLRASSVTDLDTVVRQQRERTDALQQQVAALNRRGGPARQGRRRRAGHQPPAPGRRAARPRRASSRCTARRSPWCSATRPRTRSTAPWRTARSPPTQLVVHQQDIQAVVNALWSGGAEAMTLQEQRVISTTGIKCVGNTVVLHGVPYAPPYEITAIGDLDALQTRAGLQRLHRGLQDLRRRPQPRLRGDHRRRRHHAGVRRHAATCATPGRRPEPTGQRRPRLTRSTARSASATVDGGRRRRWASAVPRAAARRSRPRSSPCCPCRAVWPGRRALLRARCPSWPRSSESVTRLTLNPASSISWVASASVLPTTFGTSSGPSDQKSGDLRAVGDLGAAGRLHLDHLVLGLVGRRAR